MSRFHKLGDEKRSVVIVPTADHEGWLYSRSTHEARSFLHLFRANKMHAEAKPVLPRKAKSNAG